MAFLLISYDSKQFSAMVFSSSVKLLTCFSLISCSVAQFLLISVKPETDTGDAHSLERRVYYNAEGAPDGPFLNNKMRWTESTSLWRLRKSKRIPKFLSTNNNKHAYAGIPVIVLHI
jgi:hypothetical protein